MFFGNVQVNREELPDVFADFFENKVKNIVENIQVDDTCYNGKKVTSCERN